MKIWVDDIREAPIGYLWCHSVNETISNINKYKDKYIIEVIDLDHDSGAYFPDGGDYIKILDYLEEIGLDIPLHIHSMNPVGVMNMRRIIKRNNWKEI